MVQVAGVAKTGNLHDGNDTELDDESPILHFSSRINDMEEAELWIRRRHDASSVTMTLKVGSVLDLRIFDLIQRINKFAKASKAVYMIIDLEYTRRIQDSGLASLLWLERILGERVEKIKLINAGHLKNIYLDRLPEVFEII